MSPLQHILRRAQRRALTNHALYRIGVGVAAGLSAAIVLLLFDRLTSVAVPFFGLWLLPATGAFAGFVHALFSMPDRMDLAVQLDRSLRLHDRIGTAATLAQQQNSQFIDPEFAALVERHAQRLAESVDVRSATPIYASGVWLVLAPLAAALSAAYLWMPRVNLFEGAGSTQAARQQQQFVSTEAQHVASTINDTVADLPRDQSLDQSSRTELESLDRLAQQLEQASIPPEELPAARDDTAARLNELADRLAQQSERELAAAQEIAQRFQGMDKAGAPQPPMSAKEFTDALTRGDFGEAAKQLDEMINDESLAETERTRTADHLRDLASHLEKELGHKSPDELQTLREQLQQALHEQGVDDQTIDQLMNDPPPSNETEEKLKQHNVDEDVARELAENIKEHQQQREVEEQTQRDAQQVNEALRKAADELDQNRNKPQLQEQQQERPSNDSPNAAEPKQSSSSSSAKDQRPEPSDSFQRQPSQRDAGGSQQQQQQQQREQQDSLRSPDGQQSSGQPKQSQSSDTQAQGRDQRSPEKPSQTSDQSTPDPTVKQDQRPQGTSQRNSKSTPDVESSQAQKQASDQPDRSPQGSQKRDDGPSPGQGESQRQQAPPDSPSEMLQRLAERRGNAEGRRNASERMKQAARELAERMTPQERERWANAWKQQQGENQQQSPPPGTGSPDSIPGQMGNGDAVNRQSPPAFQPEDLDLRGNETADQIIAEWLNDEASGPQSPQRSSAAPAAVRQAREVAERAVNEAAVQKRYHRAIQRYFSRLNETATKAATDPAPKPE